VAAVEALIKSPQIDSQAVNLDLPSLHPARAPQQPSTSTSTQHASPRPVPLRQETSSPAPDIAEIAKSLAEANDRKLKELLQARQASLEEAEAKAVAEGYARGLSEGQEAGKLEYAEAIRTLATLVESGKHSVVDLLIESEAVIASIVFEAVCKIVGKTMASPEACAAVVRQVLSRSSEGEIVSVLVSPGEYQQLNNDAEANPLGPSAALLSALSLEPDDRIELGGCILTLKAGSIDGRIETQFRTFAQSLKDALKGK